MFCSPLLGSFLSPRAGCRMGFTFMVSSAELTKSLCCTDSDSDSNSALWSTASQTLSV